MKKVDPKNILEIIKKELKTLFDNPSSYIVLIVFGVLWQFLFLRNALLIGEATLRGLFDFLPWLMLILIPSITMGIVSKEREEGTLELLVTHPINEMEIIIGKFLSSLSFVLIGIMVTLPSAFLFDKFGDFDWGVYGAQVLGGLLFAAGFISIGIYISSLFKNQIASLLVTVGVGFVLIIAGSEFFTMSLPYYVGELSERISFASHLHSISRGVLDVRDFWYFTSVTALFLYLTNLQFLKAKYGNNKKKYITFQTGALLMLGIVILTNVIGNRIPGRIDFTREKIYTLSDSTKSVLSEIDDIVTVTLYTSDKLPTQYSPVLREIRDMLNDYENSSNGNIRVDNVDPSESEEAKQRAFEEGIQEIQFNVIGQEEFQVKTGYLGLLISYGGKKESIPFVNNLGDLEYELTSIIKKLTAKDKKVVAFLTGNGEKSQYSELSILSQELEKQFDIQTTTFNEDTGNIETNADVLIIPGSNSEYSVDVEGSIASLIDRGVNVFFLFDQYIIDPENAQINQNEFSFSKILFDLGVTVNNDIVYDLQANNTIRTGTGIISYFVPYPFWIKSLAVESENPIVKKINTVDIPWGNSFKIEEEKLSGNGYIAKPLLVTTNFGGVQRGSAININPSQEFSKEGLGQKIVAVAVEPVQETPSSTKGKIVAVGDSDFIANDFTQQSAQNLAFGINAVSWLADSQTLADIKVKNRVAGELIFEKESDKSMVRYISMGVVVAAPLLVGIARYVQRRNLRSKKYEY
jgi:ABC-2 type transport system permease protein